MASNADEKKTKIIVPLNIIYDAIEMADDMWNQYLDIEEMRVVSLPTDSFGVGDAEENQELEDMVEEGWNTRFFGLPSKFDIHEYNIMEQFIWDLPEGKIQDSLERAIRGKGAFRRFKDTLYRFDMEQQWYDYQEGKYRELAVEWCEEHGFGYIANGSQNGGTVDTKDTVAIRDMEDTENTIDVGKQDNGDDLTWKEIRTEHMIQDEWIDFRRSAYRFPDGKVFEPFYSYSRKDYVVIVASDTAGNYLCVRQFRQGIKEVTTEFPAGGIERTDGKEYGMAGTSPASEDALKAAKRELLEETGYESEEWRYLLTVPSNATMADNYAHIFAAKNCYKSGGQHLDETEFLNVRIHSAGEIETMIKEGKFQQAVHIMAWLLSQRG